MDASRTFVAGGDGVDFIDLLNGNYNWGSLAPVQQPGYTQIEQAAEVIPELETVPGLQVIGIPALGAEAFKIGWKVGTALNTQWLHLDGRGLGYQDGNGYFVPQWKHAAGFTTPAGVVVPSGWELYNATKSQAIYGSCGLPGFRSCGTLADADWNLYASNFRTGNAYQFWTDTNGPTYIRVIPNAAMPSYLTIDQPLQQYTNQPSGISTGWPDPKTGAGVTSTAPPFGSGPTNPNPQEPTTQQIADGASDPTRNLFNCLMDPLDYVCPTTNSDGTQFATNGGEKVSVPDCYGMTVADCEAAVAAAGGSVTFAVADAGAADPNVADGYVVSTTPSTRVVGNPTTVQIATNPANDDPPACTSRTDNPHWSDTPPIFTVLAKGWLRCNFAAVVEASGFMWRCTDNPVTDQVALDLGEYGCQRVATASPQAIDVQPAVWSQTPVLIPNNAVVDQAPGYWIASTVGQGVVQSFSQLGWGWISDGVFGAIQ